LSAFADASALVKLYADEEGFEPIRSLEAIAIAQISRVEVPAAFWRKHRLRELGADDARILTAEFEADYFGTEDGPRRFAPVMVSGPLLDRAARLCAAHGLRAYDGVQLSSALVSRDADPACAAFAGFDHLLRGAAAAEGFALVPPGP
jgi:predicted nucleic acid-binding protein